MNKKRSRNGRDDRTSRHWPQIAFKKYIQELKGKHKMNKKREMIKITK